MAFLLILASIGAQLTADPTGNEYGVFSFASLFNLSGEKNVPAGFSTLLLLFAALLLAIITLLEWKETGFPIYWTVLAFGFLVMSFDESWALHETLSTPVGAFLGDFNDKLSFFSYRWFIPAIALLFVLAAFFSKFLLRLPSKTRVSFLIGGSLYLGGVIGVGILGGHWHALHGNQNLTYNLISTLEESLEMAGVIVFIRALLAYVADNYREVRFRMEEEPAPVTAK